MRFLTNENMPAAVVLGLRAAGHDVLSAKESLRGVSDETILRRAQVESRVLLSQDKDFGELAFRSDLPADCGIVLIRLAGGRDADVRRMLQVRAIEVVWRGQFSVVDEQRVRSRPLPTNESDKEPT